MSTDTMDQLLKSIADCTAEGGIVSLGFQGGEPTFVGLDFFRHLIQEERKYPTLRFAHTIQTNGYALNEDSARSLKFRFWMP